MLIFLTPLEGNLFLSWVGFSLLFSHDPLSPGIPDPRCLQSCPQPYVLLMGESQDMAMKKPPTATAGQMSRPCHKELQSALRSGARRCSCSVSGRAFAGRGGWLAGWLAEVPSRGKARLYAGSARLSHPQQECKALSFVFFFFLLQVAGRVKGNVSECLSYVNKQRKRPVFLHLAKDAQPLCQILCRGTFECDFRNLCLGCLVRKVLKLYLLNKQTKHNYIPTPPP